MNRLSLPMRVTPRVLRRAAIQASRIRGRRCGRRSRAASARRLYFLSCGASPTDANWKMRLSAPIRVGPWIDDVRTEPRAAHRSRRRRRSPSRGRSATSAASTASGAMTAVGCIEAVIDRSSPCDPASAISRASPSFPPSRLPAPSTVATAANFQIVRMRRCERDLEHELVAWHHRTAKTCLVDARQNRTSTFRPDRCPQSRNRGCPPTAPAPRGS